MNGQGPKEDMDRQKPYQIRVTGSIVNAYLVCKRKAGLLSREFNPDPDFDLLLLGKIVSEESYKRDKKEISLDGMRIDVVKRQDGEIIVGEIKRSSIAVDAARMQLCYYLARLKKMGLSLRGELFFPRERKRIPVELTEELEQEVEAKLRELHRVLSEERPPSVLRTGFCKRCAFFEFCFS